MPCFRNNNLALLSILLALSATLQLTHSAKGSFCKGRHPKLCHVHIGKRTFFDDREVSVPAAGTGPIDPQSPAARLLAINPAATIDITSYAATDKDTAALLQTPPQFVANKDEDVDIIFGSHPRKMRILRLIQEIMDSTLDKR